MTRSKEKIALDRPCRTQSSSALRERTGFIRKAGRGAVAHVVIAAFVSATSYHAAHAQTTKTGTLQVQMQITTECSVNTDATGNVQGATLNFGSHGLISSDVIASTAANGNGAVQVQCTAGATYAIALDAGQNAVTAGDVNTRRMANAAKNNFIHYQLYRDSNRTLVWGTASGSTVSDIADGTVKSYQVFGTVPHQTTPAAGSYNDSVTVTVTY